MKAAQIKEYGGPENVSIVDIDKPTLGEGQVLVEVHAASLNPFDTMIRSGAYKEMIPLDLPKTLGGDIAGVVVEVGAGVSDFTVGDQVYGQANAVAGNSGAFAEYAATKSSQVAVAPGNISLKEAASLPLVGVSALQALVEHMDVQSGQNVFIHGGAGGIGTVAIQIAKHLGAYVATTATGNGIDYAKQLGADEVIDYKEQDFTEILKDFDAAFDTVGGDDFTKSFHIVRPGGVAVSMIAEADQDQAAARGITAHTQSTQVTKEHLDALREFVEQGVVTAHIATSFKLEEIQQAFKERENGHITGKVILEIK